MRGPVPRGDVLAPSFLPTRRAATAARHKIITTIFLPSPRYSGERGDGFSLRRTTTHGLAPQPQRPRRRSAAGEDQPPHAARGSAPVPLPAAVLAQVRRGPVHADARQRVRPRLPLRDRQSRGRGALAVHAP